MTPNADRIKAYRARQREKGEPDSSRKNRAKHRRDYRRVHKFDHRKPFVGCDGEGAGTDEKGRQNYMLLRIGERELFTGSPLTTEQCLDFICDAPAGAILVGFAFGYDVTMILRDMPPAQRKRLFMPKQRGAGHSPYTWYKNFDVEYLPRNYFRVRRVIIERGPNGEERRIPVKGSARTIYEVFGFFQKSFVKCLKEFDVASPADLDRIIANKDRRADFTTISDEERGYCALEVDYLAKLMERLREYCIGAGIRPKTWNGAGKLAAALHDLHETPKRISIEPLIPKDVWDLASMAYYGGRFEISRTGMINQEVYEYDIRSAYPDAMRRLPCLHHGHWEWFDAASKRDQRNSDIYLSACRFRHPENSIFCGLPVRTKEGHLTWPRQGGGVYWSCEIESAKKLGAKVTLKGGWRYVRQCDCEPFAWVNELYEYRRSIGSSGPGYPIKLGINSLYGKLAQRIGAATYNNMIWAGLITAMTRAKLNEAISADPAAVVMLATDAVYSLHPLEHLDCGDLLGQWEHETVPDFFVVQPGLYWSPQHRAQRKAKAKQKSRGLSGRFFEMPGMTEKFETIWERFHDLEANSGIMVDIPALAVPVHNFVGLKLATARNNPDLAGCWVDETRQISFDWRNKRQGHVWRDGHVITSPQAGSSKLLSLPHRDFLDQGGAEPWENARAMLEDMPDYLDLSPPTWED